VRREQDEAVSREAGRQIFDALERRLALLAPAQLRLALSGTHMLGELRNRLSRQWPSPQQIQALFPDLDRRAAARVAWRIGGLEARNRILVDCIRRAGIEPVRALVRASAPALATLRPPGLLGTFHVGAVHALEPALERLPAPALALRHGPLHKSAPPLEIVTTEGDEQDRAAVFRRLLSHLQDGGFVVLALDVVPGIGLRVPCLGRTIELARGPFALARLTGAPIVPLVARWRRGGVEVVTGAPLTVDPTVDPSVRENALAAAAGRWLERYLQEMPAELGLGLLRTLLSSPPIHG
jgi:hypothetical protein